MNEQTLESEFNKLNILDKSSNNSVKTNCSYCNKPFTEELWCKECDPLKIIEGWTSENPDIDKFIKDTMYSRKSGKWIEWVPFDRFTDLKQIGEGGFSKIYSAKWIDGKANYKYDCGSWKQLNPEPIEVALKRLNGSQNMSTEYLNELKIYWNAYLEENFLLDFYGVTKDPVTEEFMIIIKLASEGNLRDLLSKNTNEILWEDKIRILGHLALALKNLHELGYFHKNLHSGNILVFDNHDYCYDSYISDFGLSGPANEQTSDDKIYGVLPYIAPEVLNGEPYRLSSDVYSFGVIMAELSSGKPPFHDRKHDIRLALNVCNGLRPEFGDGTPEIYKQLAHRCMNADLNQRPKADELKKILLFWYHSIYDEILGYKGKEINAVFKKADIKMLNIVYYKINTNAVYTSREFTFNSLSKPVNLSYIEENMNTNKDLLLGDYKNCSYCNNSFIEELWCNECDPHGMMIEECTSGNSDIDKFLKDIMYDSDGYKFLEWVPFDRFTDIKEIGEGGFSKVYSATWIDSKSEYIKQDDGSWEKSNFNPNEKVALKRLNGSQNISAEYLNELKIHWDVYTKVDCDYLKFYGITKDPETNELIMILEFANEGNLRSVLSNDFNNILWKGKIFSLYNLTIDLRKLHGLGYFHKDFHSGNILRSDKYSYISDFGLSGPANEQKSDDKIYGVLPYIAPEVLNGEPYRLSSDIYSFGVIMAELSSGKPPFHDRKHDIRLALDVCNGLRPEFGKGTPEIYKKLAYRCMNANMNKRPTADELFDVLYFWDNSIGYYNGNYQEQEKFGYRAKEIKAIFEEADKEIPNISTSYEKNPDAVYTSRAFMFGNLSKPINSSLITQYLEEDEDEDNQDSQLVDLDVKR